MIIEINGKSIDVGVPTTLSHECRGMYTFGTKKNTSVTVDLDSRYCAALLGMIGHDVQLDIQERADEEVAMELIESTHRIFA
jgi:hypothetical protein